MLPTAVLHRMKFYHLRRKSPSAQCGESGQLEVAPRGGMTIAYVVHSPDLKHPAVIEIAVAVCASSDDYCRKTGVELARMRFAEGKTIMLPYKGSVPDVMTALEALL